MSDQYTMQNPKTQYPPPGFPEQNQPAPGLAKDMDPKPDHGLSRNSSRPKAFG